MPSITPADVHALFSDCLFQDDEIVGGSPKEGDFVPAEGVMVRAGFHPGRLAENTPAILDCLGRLPLEFLAPEHGGGGGWSFLNLCRDADGELWTGDHRTMDELVCLGLATGAMRLLMPREMWSALPGGMPYVGCTEQVMPMKAAAAAEPEGPTG